MNIIYPSTGGGGISSVNYANVIYVDPTNGNDATGARNLLDKPFLTYSAAKTAAVSGDVIYMRKGTYPDVVYELKNLVDVYCEPGVILLGGFSDLYNAVTVKVLGYANFGDSSQVAFRIDGNGGDIYFEFDRIVGVRAFGIMDESDGTSTLKVKGNYIKCGTPIRVRTGNKNATFDITQLISSYNQYAVRLGSSGSTPLVGVISVTCPIIEVTGSGFGRAGVYLDVPLSLGSNHKIFINANVIRMTNLTMTETRPNIVSSAVWHYGGYNVEINANLEANACLGVNANLGGATPIFGTMVVKGDVSSNIECVSSNGKYTNGNGWGNVVFKNGFIKTLGQGASGAVIETGNGWSYYNGGVNGDLQFINCTLYNATANGKIVQHDIPNAATNKNMYFYNCVAYTEGASGFFASSVQASKVIGFHNVRSNKANDTMIADGFTPTGFLLDTTLIIPKI